MNSEKTMNVKPLLPTATTRYRTPWGELAYLCKRIHHLWCVKNNPSLARRNVGRLIRVLSVLPESDGAILREEGFAWLYQLKGELDLAIKHRREEIRLIERLHQSVSHSVKTGDYDETLARSILAHRDKAYLEKRRAMLEALIEEKRARVLARKQRNEKPKNGRADRSTPRRA